VDDGRIATQASDFNRGLVSRRLGGEARRASAEAEAINVERAADNLLQVMPDEIITSLPNANLADALGRLPSVTLSETRVRLSMCRSAVRNAPYQHHRGWRQPAI
jgi:hypothetical protein